MSQFTPGKAKRIILHDVVAAATQSGHGAETTGWPGGAPNDIYGITILWVRPCCSLIWRMRIFACMASTVDGKIGPAGVERFISISSKRDLIHLQEIRDQADGILFGAETFRTFPRVHVARAKKEPAHHFILSRSLDLDLEAPLFQDRSVPVTIFTPDPQKKELQLPEQARLIAVGASRNMMHEIAGHIQNMGIRNLLVEGGGHVLNQFISAGLLEELYLTLSFRIIGSSTAPGLTGNARFNNTPRLQVLSKEQHDNEVFLHLGLNYEDQKT